MSMRSAVAFSAIHKGMMLHRLFCSSTTVLPPFLSQATDAALSPDRAPYEPNPNLFVSVVTRVVSHCFFEPEEQRFVIFKNLDSKQFVVLTTRQRTTCGLTTNKIGLCKRTTSEGLQDAFSEFGEVVSARVVVDKGTNYSKGYGFVRYATAEEAQKGIEGMDGKFLDDWVISAEYARPTAAHATPQNNRSPSLSSITCYLKTRQ